jgi:hypothetical protein
MNYKGKHRFPGCGLQALAFLCAAVAPIVAVIVIIKG